jgi:hypothetical protein
MKKILALGMVCALSLGTLGMSTVSAHGYSGHHRHRHHSSISVHNDGATFHYRSHRHHRHHRHHHHDNW